MKNLCFIFAAVVAGCGVSHLPVTTTAPAFAPKSYSHHKTFRYVGKKQTFKVPNGVTQAFIVAIGGEGGGSTVAHGGRVSAVIPVTAGETLVVRVGGNGTFKTAGYNGGGKPGADGFEDGNAYGGGGASDIREGGDALANRILVVGGGGGQGGWDDATRGGPYGVGGKGGGLTGGTGGIGDGYSYGKGCGGGSLDPKRDSVANAGCPGTGGSSKAGGAGGSGGEGAFCYGSSGFAGSLGLGGQGALDASGTSGPYDCGGLGGGGGGGYYGGGGGGAGGGYNYYIGGGGGGGGGSSYVESTASDVHMWQGWKENPYGLIVFSW
jgi:hypothetical protein